MDAKNGMDLSLWSRCFLGHLPTPFHSLKRLSETLNARIWIKRDDLTGFGFGGNKVRKLEFLLGQALEQGADILLTTGGIQSNHARVTAAAAASQGLEARLFLTGEQPPSFNGNLLLSELMGAQFDFIGDADASLLMAAAARTLAARGRTPYVIPLGGSTPLGCLGYVQAGLEWAAQMASEAVAIEHVVVATGSGGTAAGLAVGLALSDVPTPRVHQISVSRKAEELEANFQKLVGGIVDLLRLPVDLEIDCCFYDQYVGGGYTCPTADGLEAIRLLAQTEGIIADTTYTGKSLAGMIDFVRQGKMGRDAPVAFLHTGGAPAIFSKPEVFFRRACCR